MSASTLPDEWADVDRDPPDPTPEDPDVVDAGGEVCLYTSRGRIRTSDAVVPDDLADPIGRGE